MRTPEKPGHAVAKIPVAALSALDLARLNGNPKDTQGGRCFDWSFPVRAGEALSKPSGPKKPRGQAAET